MHILTIIWQRLLTDEGSTCPRCRQTGDEIVRAAAYLRHVLEPLGVVPVLEIRDLDETSFFEHPLESNRLWINGKSLEEWLNAQTGQNLCCDECGDKECRTIEVDGKSYETIPEQLLIKAGLFAASRMLDKTLQTEPGVQADALN